MSGCGEKAQSCGFYNLSEIFFFVERRPRANFKQWLLVCQVRTLRAVTTVKINSTIMFKLVRSSETGIKNARRRNDQRAEIFAREFFITATDTTNLLKSVSVLS
jgi:hypothetical protein